MLFCTSAYCYFFVAVFVLYWAPPWNKARVWVLLGASLYFYASWSRWLALLVAGSATLDYALALGMDASARPRLRRTLLGLSLTANLGLLGLFKYCNFFLQSLHETLAAAGVSAGPTPVLDLLAPIGISFYTFEAISYTLDVYRGKLRAERNLAISCCSSLFFPHLVAGPIVRARDFLPQIRRPKRWDWLRFQVGVQYFLIGLFKKMALADRLAQFVDPVFPQPGELRPPSRSGWRRWPTPCRSTATSPATPTWPSARPTCSATSWPRISTCRTCRPTSRSSGGAGTSPCRVGCATTCSFRWAAAGAVQRDSRPQPADYHDAGRSVARRQLDVRSPGAPCTAFCSWCTAPSAFLRRRPRWTRLLKCRPVQRARGDDVPRRCPSAGSSSGRRHFQRGSRRCCTV